MIEFFNQFFQRFFKISGLYLVIPLMFSGACSYSQPDMQSSIKRGSQLTLADLSSEKLTNIELMASRGERPALFELGRRYDLGIGVHPDHAKALSFYRRSAEDVVEERSFFVPSSLHPGFEKRNFFIVVQECSQAARDRLEELALRHNGED